MNLDQHRINIIIAALKFAAISYAEQSKKNGVLIGKKQESENQMQFAQACHTIAAEFEQQARRQGVPIHMTGH